MYKLLCIVVVLITTSLQVAIAEEKINKEADINADDLIYIPDQDIFVATGNVKIEESQKILYADKVTYDVKQDKVVAEGNVELNDSGNIFHTDSMILEEKMSKGIATHLNGWLANETSIISDEFIKYSNDKYLLKNVKYSACGICTKNNDPRLMWQFVTKDTTINKKEETLLHRHLWMEVYGGKVLYLPALSHPMPGAHRKSGFLKPTYGGDTKLGTYITLPYYYVIAPNADITVTPTVYSKKDPRLEMEWRHLSSQALSTIVKGSGTYTKDTLKPTENKRVFRWDAKINTSIALDQNWTSGADILRASDDTYQRLYHISEATILPSNIYSRYIDSNSYADIKALVYQDLRPNMVTSSEPYILPYVQHSSNGYTENIEGRYKWDSALRIMQRNSNYVSDRLATSKLAWNKDYTTNNGQVFKLTPSLRLDGYASHNIPSLTNPSDQNSQIDKTRGRFIPQIMGEWKYPLAGKVINSYTILEPIVQVISSPIVYNNYEIPNEDSKDLDINSENLFSDNHFSGYDRVEGGLRSSYGVNGTTYHNSGIILSGLFGQSMHQHKDPNLYVANSGMDKKFSDYVGKIKMVHPSHWHLTYRFRINKQMSHLNYNEIVAGYNNKIFHIDTTFISTPASADSSSKRREISTDAGLMLTKNWEILFHGRRNLKDVDPQTNSRFIDLSGKLIYTGDCVKVVTSIGKRFIRDRDIKPDSYITVNLLLKTLNY